MSGVLKANEIGSGWAINGSGHGGALWRKVYAFENESEMGHVFEKTARSRGIWKSLCEKKRAKTRQAKGSLSRLMPRWLKVIYKSAFAYICAYLLRVIQSCYVTRGSCVWRR